MALALCQNKLDHDRKNMNRTLAFDMLLKTMYSNIDRLIKTRVLFTLFSIDLKFTYLFELRFYVPVNTIKVILKTLLPIL